MLPGRAGDRITDRPRPSLGETPRAIGAVDLSHVVMQHYVGGSRRTRSEKGPDDAAGRERSLQDFGLKPVVQKISGTEGHHLVEEIDRFVAQTQKVFSEIPKVFEIGRIQ